MSWPTPQDYNEAVQVPQTSFSDKELACGHATCDKLGLPRPVTGAFASVYQFRCGERQWAVRCFLHSIADQQKRYEELSNFVDHDDLECTVPFTFMPTGIRVHENWFPMLRMEWVHGANLNMFLDKNVRDQGEMIELTHRFKAMCLDLDRAGIAHGDMQHGNIMVVSDGSLRLVDYDGMYVPALRGSLSSELGHRNYQHPGRKNIHFGPYLDNFSAWVIYTSLKALAVDANLWKELHGGDECLLLRQSDFEDPLSSAAFAALERCDESVAECARRIRYYLTLPVEKVPGLNSDITSPSDLPQLPPPDEMAHRRQQRLEKKRQETVGASWIAGWSDTDGDVVVQTKEKVKTKIIANAPPQANPPTPVSYPKILDTFEPPDPNSSPTNQPAWLPQQQTASPLRLEVWRVILIVLFLLTGFISRLTSHHTSQPTAVTSVSQYGLAMGAIQQKKYDVAIADFNDILSRDSANVDALNGRAFCYRQLDDYDSAIKDADAVLQISPNDASAIFNRSAATVCILAAVRSTAITDSMRKDLEKAVSDLQGLIKYNPSPKYYYYSGLANEKLGQFASAEDDYTNCLAQVRNYSLNASDFPIEIYANAPTVSEVQANLDWVRRQLGEAPENNAAQKQGP